MLITRLRWLVPALVAGAVAASIVLLPRMGGVGDGPLNLVTPDAPPAQAQLGVVDRFGPPLLSRVSLVQQAQDGFAPDVLASTVAQAAAVDLRTVREGVPPSGIAGALPVPNSVDPAGPPTTIAAHGDRRRVRG